MAILKCKMCGGELEIGDSATIATCEYCGTKQTLPKTTDSATQNLFNRANDLRIKCEFDRAEQTYEKILELDNSDAEAHWGLLLCRYGIEYVDDPGTGKKIPTCHRASFDPILTDSDYLAAVELADEAQKELYVQEAKYIAEVQRGILQIAQSEEPFDVFLCYKETGEDGKRTTDSVIANDIYYQLTEEGYKVFYAPITLEDKLGSAYEPHIFAALNSAKVMLVIGTKPAHFDAVWVKNEWSRFLALMKKDRSKLLIPCYKDMDPYDLPDRFAHLQAQDMGKIGFINDVVRGIKKILVKAPEAPDVPVKEAAPQQSADTAALLKRVAIFLFEKNWSNANAYCEKVLDINPECAEAYLYKLMSDLHIPSTTQISHYAGLLTENTNYSNLIAFASPKMKEQVQQYEKSCRYNHAVNLLNKKSYEEAKSVFLALADFMDSSAKVQTCEQGIEKAKQDAEQARLDQEKVFKKKTLSYYTYSAILLYIALFLLYLPFLMTDLHLENEPFGSTVFAVAVLLLLPIGILYAIFLGKCIKRIIGKQEKCTAAVHRKHVNIQKYLLLFSAIVQCSLCIYDYEMQSNFEMTLVCIPIIQGLILLNCILLGFRELLAHKILFFALALSICGCWMTLDSFDTIRIIITCMVTVAVLAVALYLGKKLLKDRIAYRANLLHLICPLVLALALVVACIPLKNNAAKKEKAIVENLAGKVFVNTDEDPYTLAMIFGYDGSCTQIKEHYSYATGTYTVDSDTDKDLWIHIPYLGGDVIVYHGTVQFDNSSEIVAFGSYKWTDSIPSDDALADYVATLIAQYQAEIPTE